MARANNTILNKSAAMAVAMREVDQEIAARLAALEVLDPSQKRPAPKPNPVHRGDFMDWEGYHDLGIQSFRPQRTLGFVGSDV